MTDRAEISKAVKNIDRVLQPLVKTGAGTKREVEAARLAVQSLHILRLHAVGAMVRTRPAKKGKR